MIRNDQELSATQERISYFQGLLAQQRLTATPEEFPAVAGGYRAEIERMPEEVLTYLTRHASDPLALEVGPKDRPYRDLFPKRNMATSAVRAANKQFWPLGITWSP